MSRQKASGNIVIDSVSTLDMTMKNGDSYVTSFTDADSSYSNINFNGYKLYVNGTAINQLINVSSPVILWVSGTVSVPKYPANK